jgi:hypothetical protein
MPLVTLRKGLDRQVVTECPDLERVTRIDWLRAMPFVFLHLACLAVFAVGVLPVALEVATGLRDPDVCPDPAIRPNGPNRSPRRCTRV